MLYLIAGIVIFLGVHSVSIVSYEWRDRTAARLGPVAWRALYSIVALAGLWLAMLLLGGGPLDRLIYEALYAQLSHPAAH